MPRVTDQAGPMSTENKGFAGVSGGEGRTGHLDLARSDWEWTTAPGLFTRQTQWPLGVMAQSSASTDN